MNLTKFLIKDLIALRNSAYKDKDFNLLKRINEELKRRVRR